MRQRRTLLLGERSVALLRLGNRLPGAACSRPFRLFAVTVALALSSCSDPLGMESDPHAGGTPVARLTATLTRVLSESGNKARYTVALRNMDSRGSPVPLAPLAWKTIPATDSVLGDSVFDADGRATLQWYSLDTSATVHLLELSSGRTAATTVTAVPKAVGSDTFPAPDSSARVDTVLGYLQGGVAVRAVDQAGGPVRGVALRLAVVLGGGTVDDQELVTDANGLARTRWRLGKRAGPQSVEVRTAEQPDFRDRPASGVGIVDLQSGATAQPGQPLQIGASALPGAPIRLTVSGDTVRRDALGARVRAPVLGEDAYGNLLVAPAVRLSSLDTNVVQVSPDGLLLTTGNGLGRVRVSAGTATASFVVDVRQVPVRVVASANPDQLYWLGAHTVVGAAVLDRLGAPLRGSKPAVRSLTPTMLSVVAGDSVRALAAGTGVIEVSYAGLADSVPISTKQVPARIVLPSATDTMDLGQSQPLAVQVLDSGGSVIATPPLALRSDNDSVVTPGTPASLNARLPGETNVSIQSGPAAANLLVTVEGVALLADGVPNPDVTALSAASVIELTNGRIRLLRHPRLSEKAAFEMDVRVGRDWVPATVYGAGDWTYVTSTVLTAPTSMAIVENTPDRVAISMRFGNHMFDPVLEKFPSSYQETPYPFTKTVWLRPREYGYYSWIQTEGTMPWSGTEQEIGFGGLFGPARIRTGQLDFITDTLRRHKFFNGPPAVPDAAEFDLSGDPLMRVLVPLPEAPMISPVFPGWGYGSVFVHRVNDFSSYGAYLYAAPRSVVTSPRQICQNAWQQAPFSLRTLSQSELDVCGPS